MPDTSYLEFAKGDIVKRRNTSFVIASLLVASPLCARAASLQPAIDAAQPGTMLTLPAGNYDGPVFIDKPLTIHGAPGATLRGNGQGNVIHIRADHVTVEGLHVCGSGLNLGKDDSAIFVQGNFAVIRGNQIDGSLHGIYLKKVTDCQLLDNRISGKAETAPPAQKTEFRPDGGENCEVELNQNRRGNGIHLWNSERITVRGNEIRGMRDGIYFSFTHHSQVARNTVMQVRFGLHYMYSDYNTFEGNRFCENAAGAVVMYSKGLLVRGNTFSANIGQRAYGMVLIAVDGSRLEDNRIVGNSIGLFLELSNNNALLGNRIAHGYIGARLTGGSDSNKFSRNVFAGNLHPVEIDGSLGENQWAVDGVGNQWSTAEVDLNGRGIGSLPHHEIDLLGNLRRPFPLVALLSGSPAIDLVRFAEQHAKLPNVPAIVDPAPLTAGYRGGL